MRTVHLHLKKVLFGIGIAAVLMFADTGIVYAQDPGEEGIWAPYQGGEPQAEVAEGQADDHHNAAEPDALLREYIRLQADLYRIVMTFHEQAKGVEREIRNHEEIVIRNHALKMTTPAVTLEDGTTGVPGVTYFRVPSLCAELDASLKRYIDKNTGPLDHAVRELVAKTKQMTEDEKAAMADKIRGLLAEIPNMRRAEEILYLCLYRYKNELGVQPPYQVEKTMRIWFSHQEPLLDAWLGNVD